MILSFDDLAFKFREYVDVKGKIRREVEAGRLIKIKKDYTKQILILMESI